jgi:hypothetical protein
MTYTLTFSTIQGGQRKPLLKDGREVTLVVEADSKTATYSNPAVIDFCNTTGNDCRIRGVT